MFITDRKREYFLGNFWSIITEIFKISLVSYLLFYLVDKIWPGFVTDYFNINIILIVALTSGVMVMSTSQEQQNEDRSYQLSWHGVLTVIVAGLAGSVIIYYQIQQIGKMAYAISALAGVLIIMMLLLINIDDSNEERNE